MESKQNDFLKKALLLKFCRQYRNEIFYCHGLAEEFFQKKQPRKFLDRLMLLDCTISRIEKNIRNGNYRRAWHFLGLLNVLPKK